MRACFRLTGAALVGLLLTACATRPPSQPDDICLIFQEKPKWYRAASASQARWGTPIGLQMAIMHQESTFRFDARPPRKKYLGFIPGPRASDAYGYAQVKKATWQWYIDKTGRRGADRDDFADAIDFVGWYTDMSQRLAGISKWDARAQYLAYHEGHGGYKSGSYRSKQWLLGVADKVAARASRYNAQLKRCEADLDKGGWWPF